MAINDYLRTSSINVEGNLNFRKLEERNRYNRWILGQGSRAEMGHEEVATNPTSRPPSWTQTDTKLDHAFVIRPLSASHHEKVVLNTYVSGSSPLEQGVPVPASGNLYYDKRSRLVSKTYALTASSNTPGNYNNYTYWFPTTGSRFRLAGFPSYTSLSSDGATPIGVDGGGQGLYFWTGSGIPDIQKTYKITVPDYGRLVDIKVWVEFVGDDFSGDTAYGPRYGASFVGIRSPNVKFESGYVLRNDLRIPLPLHHDGTPPVTGGLKACYRNTYVLWDIPARTYAKDDDDFGMRTIFWDSAKVWNPRHLNLLFKDGPTANYAYFGELTQSYPRQRYNDYFSVASGSTPWTSEMGLVASSRAKGGMTGSPPPGWLNGAGGKAAENEWPTTGVNWGPDMIRPRYPLLDDIVEIRPATGSRTGIKEYRGFRPGLRGTEINGDWELVIASQNGGNQDTDIEYMEGYFRQFRLEILYEQNYSVPIPRNARKSNFSNFGNEEVLIMSGVSISSTQTPDLASKFVNTVEIANQYNQYGTTVGITNSTSSITNFAVFSRITGALADKLTGSEHGHLRYLFLNNRFGTPFISLASGSGEDITVESFSDVNSNNRLISDIFRPLARVGSSYTLKTALSGKNTTQKTRDIALEKVTGSF